MLINGRHLKLVLNSQQQQDTENQMPVTQGYVVEHKVTALRDTGCSSVVVKEKFVKKEEYIRKHGQYNKASRVGKNPHRHAILCGRSRNYLFTRCLVRFINWKY